ncbi:acyltransferase family protein [Burkholderia plantarii]|uniref:Acyltransferase n=1 Tax=Burkholderia plantarii TaxID=41899 RepID=A0A0B6S6C7_BURPL|nr:acyltransferase [Burkholderia plantarii]AJK49984.1 acyltransferase [Burkholderia plantarii]WLE63212.1 acyltransferase [Burkholderia plantarii]
MSTPPPAAGARPRDNFDAIRLAAALTVLYGHAFPLTGGTLPPMFGNEVASLAVKVFFVISGYLVIESWRRDPSPGRYLQRRMLRIFPGLAVNVLSCAFVLGPLVSTLPLGDYLRSPLLPRYLENILLRPASLLPGVFHALPYPDAVNGSLWTLPVEFGMYLATPLLVLRGGGQPTRILAGCLALCAASLYLLRIEQLDLAGHGRAILDAFDVAPYFLLGAAWRIVAPRSLLKPQVAMLLLPVPMLVPGGGFAYELGLLLILPYATLSLALARPAALGWAGRLGDFSYGIYIYAFPVQQAVALGFHTDRDPLLNAALSMPPTLLLAALSWHGVEKRFLRLKPRGSPARTEAANAGPIAG